MNAPRPSSEPPRDGLRERLYIIIFEADTPGGKAFDVLLIMSILLSVLVVMLDSVASFHATYGRTFFLAEWFFTVLFSIEYLLRLYCVRRAHRYALSFFGLVDLLAILPTYASLFLPGTHFLAVVRVLRVLRIFRVLKLMPYVGQMDLLMSALRASMRKIIVFLFSVLTLVTILGSVMYIVEKGEHGFTNIPQSIYWAIVTLTTVGYGDISPATDLGRAIAAMVMIIGYSIIAIPTGIVGVGLAEAVRDKHSNTALTCHKCGESRHERDSTFCRKCGTALKPANDGA